MAHLFQLFQSQDIIGAIRSAVAAIDAYLRLVLFVIPEHSPEWASFSAIITADT
jgi:hypothetical protein